MSAIEILAMTLCSALGLFIGHRAALKALTSRWLSPLELTRIGFLSVLLAILSSRFSPMKSLNLSLRIFLLIHIPLILTIFLAWLILMSRRRAQVSRIDEIVTELSIQMRRGLSLRSALESMSEEIDPILRSTVQELARNVAFSQQNDAHLDDEFQNLARELRWIERESVAPLQSILQLREKIRTMRLIRRKSRQASAQARAQSSVMSLMYVLLATASSLFFGWKASSPWIFNSIAPFSLGVLWIWRGSQRVRWTL